MRPVSRSYLTALVLLLSFVFAEAVHVSDVYRLVQFDRNSQPFGSRRKMINHLATVLNEDYEPPIEASVEEEPEPAGGVEEPPPAAEVDEDEDDEDDEEVEEVKEEQQAPKTTKQARSTKSEDKDKDLARNLVVVRIDELTVAKLAHIVDKRGASGVLIVLENDLSEVNEERLERWKVLERFMLSRAFEVPIYFTFRDEDIDEMHETMRSQSFVKDSVHDRYRMVVTGSEATPIPTVTINNLQGWQHAAPSAAVDSGNSVPTIAIVANYDTFGAAPGLSFGVDQNGSGVVALLELARIFSRLYSEFRTHGPYEILFVLTGAGRLNFAGTKRWLRTVELSVLESLEFALCLESLGSLNDPLYLHVSKNPRTPEIRTIYDSFAETATLMDIPFEIIHKKINISSPYINWQHEQFSRKRILSATLSSRKEPSPAFSMSSMFDTREGISVDHLSRNIKFVAEVVTKMVYGLKDKELEVVNASLGVNKHFVEAWTNYLAKQPRQAHELSQNQKVVTELENVLKQHTSDSLKTSFSLESNFKFFTSGKEEMSVYKVKPFTFYALMALAVLVYLGVIYLYFVAPSNMEEFKALFASKSSGKKNR